MPIKIPDGLPAFEALVTEGVRVMTEAAAIRQDIRPLQIGLLNLMPNKIKTELQMARLLGASPLQVDLTLIRLGGHKTKHTSEDHMVTFYQPWDEAKYRKFDGFLVTGTPLETIAYEEVTYWDEMQRIFDWTVTNVHSTMNVCWGAMAALYHFHGVPKHVLPEKAFGVYNQTVLQPTSHYLAGFADDFSIPISRWAEIRVDDVKTHPELSLLCQSAKGASIVEEQQGKRIYVLDHLEYDGESLADEYFRDVKANVPIKLPHGYFPDGDTTKRPPNRWRAHGHLMISNWINEIYQSSPYDIAKIGERRG
jgi:homoserine O-succinyltransferase